MLLISLNETVADFASFLVRRIEDEGKREQQAADEMQQESRKTHHQSRMSSCKYSVAEYLFILFFSFVLLKFDFMLNIGTARQIALSRREI